MPTGWTYENKRTAFPVKVKDHLSIHLVPYSEHSSFPELQEYVRFLRPHRVRLTSLCPCHGTIKTPPCRLLLLPDPAERLTMVPAVTLLASQEHARAPGLLELIDRP